MNSEQGAAAERLERVRERMAAAARASGRALDDITLVAVSKFHPVEAVRTMAALGQRHFGENYVQEALAKREALTDFGLHWHFIGKLQSNKAHLTIGVFELIHSVDTAKLVHILQKCSGQHALDTGTPFCQDLLLEVNLGGEAQKAGVDPEALEPLALEIRTSPNLRLCGLMCLPPVVDDAEASRPYFIRLRELRDSLSARLGQPLPQLSMGMSMDYEVAIAEGATMVRVGTDLFGPRPARP